ncbi:MAG TPA: NAD(P)/FAD-dependent oxidoreductase [Mycobacteriales bacterium]|nr:NAD(P)/FAD-dependent oxidoreductase [Mycobacteriales bacterium]
MISKFATSVPVSCPMSAAVRRVAKDARRSGKMRRVRRPPSVAVLGAGAGGLAMGVALRRAGFAFTIFEKRDGVGGTWRDNTYPGAACDVPSHLYSFSFAPNPGWSRTYATQPEILAYLEGVADRFGLRPHIRTGQTVERARWLEDEQEWLLTTSTGEAHRADVLVSALGMLNVPFQPAIPGLDSFRGRVFHSSRWDHSKPLAGERVASIGTGASAIQYVPAIAGEVEHLTVFQRTPIWVSPRFDAEYTAEQQQRFAKSPLAAKRHRWGIFWTYQRASFQAADPMTAAQTELARGYLDRKVADPALRAILTPDFPVGCKRPLTSRTWFPALTRPNVRVVTAPITRVTPEGIETADGEEHRVDTIIFGTGFRANEYLTTVDIAGRGGHPLRERWRDGAEAYLGLTVSRFPNFFMLYGPNTNGVNSILFMHEAQCHYVVRALRMMRRRRLTSIDVRRDVERRYNLKVQAGMTGTVWQAGCRNYYTVGNGKNITQLPYSAGEYWVRTRIVGWWRYHRMRRRQPSRRPAGDC